MMATPLKKEKKKLVVVVLLVLGTLSQASQYMLPFLYAVARRRGAKYSLRAALNLSPALFSVLAGYASGGPRALTQLLAGQVGTAMSRSGPQARCLALAGALLVQCCGGVLLATAKESRDAVVAQVLIGLGSGPLYPLGYSIIACYYEAKDCGTPNGVFSQTAYFGPALASLSVLIARTEKGLAPSHPKKMHRLNFEPSYHIFVSRV